MAVTPLFRDITVLYPNYLSFIRHQPQKIHYAFHSFRHCLGGCCCCCTSPSSRGTAIVSNTLDICFTLSNKNIAVLWLMRLEASSATELILLATLPAALLATLAVSSATYSLSALSAAVMMMSTSHAPSS
jgi:hypothetical protein